jgi:hypothetical protein
MANTVIQLKFSDVTSAPPSLNVGEAAYSNTSQKLFIGDSVNNVLTIGGKFYVDQQGLIFTKTNVAFDTANSAASYANAAFTVANTGGSGASYANSAFVAANSAGVYANSGFTAANTADTKATSAGVYANSAFAAANTADVKATSAGVYGNSAFSAANTADDKAVSAGSYGNSAFTTANSSGVYANSAFSAANTADVKATSAGAYANAAFSTANTDVTNISISAADYGSASAVAAFRVEANGRISSANSTAIAIAASAITSGTLGVARGGSGAGTFTNNGVLLGQGTSAFTTASSSTEGHVLTINASGVPAFSHLQGGTF